MLQDPDSKPHTPAPQSVDQIEASSSDFLDLHWKKIAIAALVFVAAAALSSFWAFQKQSRALAAEKQLSQASTVEEYQLVVTSYPNLPQAAVALLEQGRILEEAGKPDEAIVKFQDFLRQFPDHALAGGATVSVGSLQETKGLLDEALATYQSASTKYGNSYSAPLAMISSARIFQLKKQPDEARRIYETVVTQYPLSLYAAQANEFLNRKL